MTILTHKNKTLFSKNLNAVASKNSLSKMNQNADQCKSDTSEHVITTLCAGFLLLQASSLEFACCSFLSYLVAQ